MGRKFAKKDPDEGLPENFREAVASMDTTQIRQKMADIILLDIAMREVQEKDKKFQDAKAAYEQLAEPYKTDFKSFKKQLAICKEILDDKNGGAISARLEEEHLAAKEAKRTAGLRPNTGPAVGTVVPATKFHETLDKLIKTKFAPPEATDND
jgi:hypothetical protein